MCGARSRNSFIPITVWVWIRWCWLVWRSLPWKSLSPFSEDYPRCRGTLYNACGGSEGPAISLIRNMVGVGGGGSPGYQQKNETHFSCGANTDNPLSQCGDFKQKRHAGKVSATFRFPRRDWKSRFSCAANINQSLTSVSVMILGNSVIHVINHR